MNAEHPLLSDDELQAMADWCQALLKRESRYDADHGPLSPEQAAFYHGWFQTMRSVAVEAGRRGRVDLAPFLLKHADNMAQDRWVQTRLRDQCEQSVAMLLNAGAPITQTVIRMARSKQWSARHAVARGLLPDGAQALSLLRVLAADAHVQVRQTARDKLAQIEELAWWTGLFERDPLAALDPDEAAALGPALQVIVEYLNGDSSTRKGTARNFVAAVDSLPDDPAAAVLRRLATSEYYDGAVPALIVAFTRRANAADVLWSLLDAGRTHDDDDRTGLGLALLVENVLPDAAPARRHRLALSWCRRLCTEAAPRRDEFHSAHKIAERLLPRLWPQGADATQLVELLEALPSNDGDSSSATTTLVQLLALDPDTAAAQLWRILEVLRRSKPNQYVLQQLISALPQATREAFAARFLEDGDPTFRCVALQCWVEREVASGQTDPRQALLGVLQDEPRRQHLFATPPLLSHFDDALREPFERGELTLAETAAWLRHSRSVGKDDLARYRQRQQAVLDRVAAGAPDANEQNCRGLLGYRPAGPWQREDLQLLDAACELAQRIGQTRIPNSQGSQGSQGGQGRRDNYDQLVFAVAGAILDSGEGSLRPRLEQLITLAARQRLPVFHGACLRYERYCHQLDQEPLDLRALWPQEEDDCD